MLGNFQKPLRYIVIATVALLAMVWGASAQAAQVIWDQVVLVPGVGTDDPNVGISLPSLEWHGSGTNGYAYPSLEVCLIYSYDALAGWTLQSGGPGSFSGTVYQAEAGDIVDFANSENASPTFEYMGIRRNPKPERTPLTGDADQDFYLAFSLEKSGSAVYGWVQMNVSPSGELQLLHSALDLDGGPIIVGGGSASPEPTSALLLLLGAGVLGLRRRRCPACSDSAKNAPVSRPSGKIG